MLSSELRKPTLVKGPSVVYWPWDLEQILSSGPQVPYSANMESDTKLPVMVKEVSQLWEGVSSRKYH
jgi:hypothetical protein